MAAIFVIAPKQTEKVKLGTAWKRNRIREMMKEPDV